jgi:hypothetical protein
MEILWLTEYFDDDDDDLTTCQNTQLATVSLSTVVSQLY